MQISLFYTKSQSNSNVFCIFFVSICSEQKVDPELIFTKQERIGKGSFGEVFKGIDNRTQQVCIDDVQQFN